MRLLLVRSKGALVDKALKDREAKIRAWFSMWLDKTDGGIEALFSSDAVYVESWGPVYRGARSVKHWFEEWNSRGTVRRWEIEQFFHKGDQTVVEWYFEDEMADGRAESFDGVSLVRWSPDGKIAFLKEFGCSTIRYDPYECGGSAPGEQVPWLNPVESGDRVAALETP
ncbi:nuclear transport factor 2 family protein [Collinsella sp. OF02-10]|nr:nuclear transport factor 2 family protein [Collinsella sp. OF02-10]HIS40466.1 nuclear transport factor 2 family protein [Candidatus Aphodovivens avistercoris]